MNRLSTKALVMFLAALTMLSLATRTVSAQAPASPDKQEMMAKLEKMSTELQLTPAQKQQMLPILMQEAPKMKALKSNTSLGPLQKAMQMKQISDETDTKIKPILNPGQYQKFEAMRAQEKEQMKQEMMGGH